MNRYVSTSLWLIATSALVLGLAGCATSSESKSKPAGWKTLSVMRVVAVERVLGFAVPPDMEEIPVQGVDSLAKAYRSPMIELNLGYGRFSDPLNYSDKPGYTRSETVIDGRSAYIITFEDVVALHVPKVYLLSAERLTLSARCKDDHAREQVMQLFRTIRFRLSPPA